MNRKNKSVKVSYQQDVDSQVDSFAYEWTRMVSSIIVLPQESSADLDFSRQIRCCSISK